ncbi:MAG: hypothetical protein P8P48_07525 [Saprospiraceae bacterium]|nr:hypothetical protein [Saprospiraceae bacterium]
MRSVFKLKLVLLLSLFAGSVFGASIKQVYTKNIKKEFTINPEGLCKISNKYGLIELRTWDKDKVKIDVLISINAGSESSANKTMESIFIQFENTSDFVSASTEIKEKISSWGSNKNLSIDYLIYLPKELDLELINKYGDVKIPKHNGNIDLNVKHCDVSINELKGKLQLNLGYGNFVAKSLGEVVASVSYSDVSMGRLKSLELNSKYSEFALPIVHSLELNSKYDELKIGAIKELDVEAKYTDFEIGTCDRIWAEAEYSEIDINYLKNSAKLNMRYGDASISSLEKGFGLIKLSGKYTDFSLKVAEGCNYQVKAVGDYAGIDYPNELKVTYEVEKSSFHEVEGYIGIQGSRSTIQAVLDYGGLEINE